MQWINSKFAKEYNRLTGQSGHVWKERYFSLIIEMAEQIIETFENIVKGSVGGGQVQDAKEYLKCSMYRHLHKKKDVYTEETRGSYDRQIL
jgi:hypothetical protein